MKKKTLKAAMSADLMRHLEAHIKTVIALWLGEHPEAGPAHGVAACGSVLIELFMTCPPAQRDVSFEKFVAALRGDLARAVEQQMRTQ